MVTISTFYYLRRWFRITRYLYSSLSYLEKIYIEGLFINDKKKQYTEEFKEQVLHECQEVGNVFLVARRHDISSYTIHGWINIRERGAVKPLPRNDIKRIIEYRKKKLLEEKEFELAVLRDLRDRADPW